MHFNVLLEQHSMQVPVPSFSSVHASARELRDTSLARKGLLLIH